MINCLKYTDYAVIETTIVILKLVGGEKRLHDCGGFFKKKMIKTCFVILHYGKDSSNTLLAIDSISNLNEKADIVVVCNGKEFDIAGELSHLQANIVKVIVNEKNEGFSKGNNIGYYWAKQTNKYDFIIIINNDIQIGQKDFLKCVYALYEKYNFYVCGPDVYNPVLDVHTSPIENQLTELTYIENKIRRKESEKLKVQHELSIYTLKQYFFEVLVKRNAVCKRINKYYRKLCYKEPRGIGCKTNTILQGSCLIFSKQYIEKNKSAFYPEVFLYFEEAYLYSRCAENGWLTLYSDEIRVEHFHRESLGWKNLSLSQFRHEKEKQIDLFIDSAKKYYDYLKCRDCS